MQTTTYNPVATRNIPAEMAELARERGEGLTRVELLSLGFTEEQIDKHSAAAGRLFAQGSIRRLA